MDAVQPHERLLSILNDNDSPSFAVRPRPSFIDYCFTKQEQPRHCHPDRHYPPDLPATPTPLTPPSLRLGSTSSKASSSTMDSPSPKTPVYTYDPQLFTQYGSLLRQNAPGQLSSPSTVTPIMDTMMIIATPQDQMLSYKGRSTESTMAPHYAGFPIHPAEGQQPPQVSSFAKPDQHAQASSHAIQPTTRKNKYPCPYASSHHCTATFTTSGHAARHGKKHTGEKGVHCPVCNKAFTRKDNMKQHERIHKGSASGSNSDDTIYQRRKAAMTKDASRNKKASSDSNQVSNKSALTNSPLGEVASIDPSVIGTPSLGQEHSRFSAAPTMANVETAQPVSAYPPLGEEASFNSLAQLDRNAAPALSNAQPPIQRPFSDLDTLALAAAYNPYSQSNIP